MKKEHIKLMAAGHFMLNTESGSKAYDRKNLDLFVQGAVWAIENFGEKELSNVMGLNTKSFFEPNELERIEVK